MSRSVRGLAADCATPTTRGGGSIGWKSPSADALGRGYDGAAVALPTTNRIKRLLKNLPLVSIIIPSDAYEHILDTVNSIKSKSMYRNYEIVVVTNPKVIAAFEANSTRACVHEKPFNFSDKCNVGVRHASGEYYLIFLNDDVGIISCDWIESILETATLPGVGGVSPKLVYENGTIQYAGLVIGVRLLVGTAFHTYPARTAAYFNLAQSVREVSVLSGACLAISKPIFNEIGGWNSDNTPISHSDKKNKADIFILQRWGYYCERDPCFPPKMCDLVYVDSQDGFLVETSRLRKHSATGKDLILFSHDLSASGAPRCLHHAAKVLIEEGHYVLVMAPEEGPIRQRFISIGDRIEAVDFLWKGGPIENAIPHDQHGTFDAIVASQVIEHFPDPLGFLTSSARLLKEGGLISLVIPDKRFCFDFFKPVSLTSDYLYANFQRRTRHTKKTAFDNVAMNVLERQGIAWYPRILSDFDFIGPDPLQQALVTLNSLDSLVDDEAGDYVDFHTTEYTPSSFRLIVLELGQSGMVPFSVACSFPTSGCEFYAALRKRPPEKLASHTLASERRRLMKGVVREVSEEARYLQNEEP